MGASGYKPEDGDRVTSNTDILGDLPQRHAREDLVPMIARLGRNASNVAPVYFEYFQRVKTGRRCSCFEVETDPSGVCLICYGTGIVVGYQKRGTKTEVFDVTYPNVSCANTTPDYNKPTRPVFWSLVKSSVYGTIEFEINLKTNVGILDVLDIKDYSPAGTEIQYYLRSPAETDFIVLTENSLQVRLGQQKLYFRVVMKRSSPNSPLPKLVGIRIAYRLMVSTEVRVDIPRTKESLVIEELGVYQNFSGRSFWLDSTLKNISMEDWMYNSFDGTRWKITEVSDNVPLGILVSWDLMARLIQPIEGYYQVPIGKTVQKQLPQFIKSIQTDIDFIISTETDQEGSTFELNSRTGILRSPGNRAENPSPDGPTVTPPGQTDISNPRREV